MMSLLDSKSLDRFCSGPTELLIAPRERRRNTERQIRDVAMVKLRAATPSNPFLLASDGSAYGTLSATGAVVGPVTVSMRMPHGTVSSLHGELSAAITAALIDDVVRDKLEWCFRGLPQWC